MVTLPQIDFKGIESSYSFLQKQNFVPEDIEFIERNKSIIPQRMISIVENLCAKEKLNLSEKRYIEWIRFSIAFKLREFHPKVITHQWSSTVKEILSLAWSKHLPKQALATMGLMGKLGSDELNLSSDIDLIFFSEDPNLLSNFRDFHRELSASDQFPKGFLVDLELRPEGNQSPLLVSPDRLGFHLWKQSDPWERYSYTRMNLGFGDPKLREKISKIRDQFCYRKHMTLEFFPKFLELRKKYHSLVPSSTHHIKLGKGGIRDLELFFQTFQIIYGGRSLEFRNKSSFEVSELLTETLPEQSSNKFKNLGCCYSLLRQLEGELHSFEESGGFTFTGQTDLEADCLKVMEYVHSTIEDYAQNWKKDFLPNRKNSDSELKNQISNYGTAQGISWDKIENNYNLFFGDEKSRLRTYKDAVLNQESLKNLFFDLLCHSPWACQVLSRRPSLLDLLIVRKTEDDLVYENEEDLIGKLIDLKMINHILSTVNFAKSENLEKLQNDLNHAFRLVMTQVLKFHDLKESEFNVLLLGKAASGELGLKSDIDLVFFTQSTITQELSRKAKKFLRTLSSPTPFGTLVPFDRDGGPASRPLLVNKDSLVDFLENEAPAWQQLMYMKNRMFHSSETLKYRTRKVSTEIQNDLDQILHKRLKTREMGIVPFKTSPGGIFHCEFTLGNILLIEGLFPKLSSFKGWAEELSKLKTVSASEFTELSENYQELRTQEQKIYNSNPQGPRSTDKLEKILAHNIDLIETLRKRHITL